MQIFNRVFFSVFSARWIVVAEFPGFTIMNFHFIYILYLCTYSYQAHHFSDVWKKYHSYITWTNKVQRTEIEQKSDKEKKQQQHQQHQE